ncbi:unnamed protein product, partial [Choristocarpus tenellus]
MVFPSESKIDTVEDDERSAAFLVACCNHNLQSASTILKDVGNESTSKGVFLVQSEDEMKDTPLHLAASAGDVGIVELLLRNGAKVNVEDNLGSTPLNRAAVAGHLQVLAILLDHGSDPEHLDDISGTALHAAARRNHSSCCKLLLSRGADADVSNGIGNRPLHMAAAEGGMSALEVTMKLVVHPSL